MINHVNKIIQEWDDACHELDDCYKLVEYGMRIAMAASDNLFKVNEDAVTFQPMIPKLFHNRYGASLGGPLCNTSKNVP